MNKTLDIRTKSKFELNPARNKHSSEVTVSDNQNVTRICPPFEILLVINPNLERPFL
jgi:hypothetical protein